MNSIRMHCAPTLMFAALLFLAPWAVAQEGDAQPDSESNRIDQILRQMSDFLASTPSFGFTAHELIDQVEEGIEMTEQVQSLSGSALVPSFLFPPQSYEV